MAGIRTLDDLRRLAPPELADASPEDLVREYARDAGLPFSQVANFLGVKPGGTAGYLADQAASGYQDLKRMAGQGLKFASREAGLGPSETGQEWVDSADQNAYQYDPDERGRGAVAHFVGTGVRAAVPIVPGIAAGLLGAPEIATAGGLGLLFGTSSGQDSYEKVRDAGGSEADATDAGRLGGAIQGGGEYLQSLLGLRYLKGAGRLLGLGEAPTAAGVAAELTTAPTLRQFGLNTAKMYGSEMATEAGQDVGQAKVEQAYGAAPTDLLATAKDSAYGAAALTTLMGPLAFMGHVQAGKRAAVLNHALFGDHGNEAVRARAIDSVMEAAHEQGVQPDDLDSWFEQQLQRMDDDRDARQQAQVHQALAPSLNPGTGATLTDVIGDTTGAGRAPAAGPDYVQMFEDAYNAPTDVERADGTTDTAPAAVAVLRNAGYTDDQIKQIMAERARTHAPQQEPLDLLGGRAVEQAPGVQQGLAMPELSQGTTMDPNQLQMPLGAIRETPAPGPTLALPAPSGDVMVTDSSGTSRPTTMRALATERANRVQAERERLAAQGDTSIPAGRTMQVDAASQPQINRGPIPVPAPAAVAEEAPAKPAKATKKPAKPAKAAATEVKPAEPAPVAERHNPYTATDTGAVDPDMAARERIDAAGKKAGVIGKVAATMFRGARRDSLTGKAGVYSNSELVPAVRRAVNSGEKWQLVEGDMFNLAGANKALGSNSKANNAIKEMAAAWREAFHEGHSFRRKGATFAALVPASFDVQQAQDEFHAALAGIAKKYKLSDIENPKAPGATGVAMHFGATEVGPGAHVDQLFDKVQNDITAARPQETKNVDRSEAFETWAGASGGPTREAARRVAAADSRGREAGAARAGRETEALAPKLPAKRAKPAGVFLDPEAADASLHNAVADSAGLTAEQRALFSYDTPRDPVTGWFTEDVHTETIDRANKLVAENPDVQGVYVSIDISNLGGLNEMSSRLVEAALREKLGDKYDPAKVRESTRNALANEIYRGMANIVLHHAQQLEGVDIVPIRQGGDEVSLTIVGKGAALNKVKGAMKAAEYDVQRYVNSLGLQGLPHGKEYANAAKNGAGVYIGTTTITGAGEADKITDRADRQVESNKAKGKPDAGLRTLPLVGDKPTETREPARAIAPKSLEGKKGITFAEPKADKGGRREGATEPAPAVKKPTVSEDIKRQVEETGRAAGAREAAAKREQAAEKPAPMQEAPKGPTAEEKAAAEQAQREQEAADAEKARAAIDARKAKQAEADAARQKAQADVERALGEEKPAPAPEKKAPLKERVEKAAQDDRATAIIDEVESTNGPLKGDEQSPGSLGLVGRSLRSQDSLKKIRDAIVGEPHAKLSAGEQKIVDSVLAFKDAYNNLLNTGSNWARSSYATSKVTRNYQQKDEVDNVEARVDARFEGTSVKGKVEKSLATREKEAMAAFNNMMEAFKGSGKDAEIVVRLVKDFAQNEVLNEGTQETEEGEDAGNRAAELRSLDARLSSGWAAAKRGVFNGDRMDLADVNPGAARDSAEQQVANRGGPSKLQRLAKDGVKVGATQVHGILAVLHHLRGGISMASPMENVLSRALYRALTGVSNRVPGLEWTNKESFYDPTTNTIHLNPEASNEVVLHETFHAALQWYVYSNPKDAAVQQLQRSLNTVLNWNKPLSPQAEQVRTVLRDLVANKRDLDAVLELVSYSTTMNEFRRELDKIPSTGVDRSFFNAATDIWRWLTRAAQRLLGTSNTVASDVLVSSMKLLGEAANTQIGKRNPGMDANRLYAAITSRDNRLSPVPSVSDNDYRAWAEGPGKWKSPTQLIFEAAGFGENGKVTKALEAAGSKAADYIRQNLPAVETFILNFNSKFSNSVPANAAIDRFKTERSTGYMQMEKIATYLDAHPEHAKPFLAYMDGDKTALDGIDDGGRLRSTADSMGRMFKDYIASLPPGSAEQKFFTDNKFSDYLLFAGKTSQVAGTTFGVKKLADMVGTETRHEDTLEESVKNGWLPVDTDDMVPMTGRKMYEVLREEPLKPGVLSHVGYIDAELFDKQGTPAGFAVSTDRVWRAENTTKGYKFVTSRTAKQAIEDRNTKELTTALLNTTAALSHTYASRNYLDAMAKLGYGNGKPTASAVAFNSIDDVNAAFPGRDLKEEQILNASDDASESPFIKAKLQRTGTWVRLPKSETYGALAGKLMPGPVWNAMHDMHDRSPLLNSRAFNGTMRWFKKAKTIYNPGTHITNVLTNYTLAYLHGMSMSTVNKSAKLLMKYEFRPNTLTKQELATVQAFLDSGAMLGQFSSSEVKQAIYENMAKSFMPESESSFLTKLKSFADYEKRKAQMTRFDDKAMELYAAEDNAFRLAAFLHTAGNIQLRDGTEQLSDSQLAEAGLAARKMFLDYDIDARAIRAMRQSILPFVSWSYAIAPVLGRLALTKPWAMANVVLAYMLMSAATEDDDDREAAPEYLRDRAFGVGPYMHMRMPFLGDDENPVYFNTGKYVPMYTLFQPPPGNAHMAGQDWLPGFVTPGGPFVAVINALSGFDTFTGKPIHQPTDTEWDKLMNTGQALYDIAAPTALNSSFWSDAKKLAAGPGADGVEPSPMAMVRKLSGFGFYQFNVDQSRQIQETVAKGVRRDFEDAMRKAKREEMAKGYPDYEELDAELGDLRERMLEREAEVRGQELETDDGA